ncbi:hypothetical protein [Actinophytocola sp.]|uniref:hypothetical protein n=1 Tax=Actinophytocola sp. TaxID=1872138 RepID=UPI002EDB274A
MAYVGQVQGQASWHWLTAGLLAALVAAHLQQRTRPDPDPEPAPKPEHTKPKKRPKARDAALGIGALGIGAALIAAGFILVGPLDSNVPDDAPDISAAHVGDCVGTTRRKYGWYVVPCWYKAATYLVVNIGLRRILGPTNRTTPADALKFCQDSPGWDAAGRFEPAYPDYFTAVTVCLTHK